jgi:hypothetical protein
LPCIHFNRSSYLIHPQLPAAAAPVTPERQMKCLNLNKMKANCAPELKEKAAERVFLSAAANNRGAFSRD